MSGIPTEEKQSPAYEVVKNPVGFLEIQPKPTQDELKQYYAEQFYQQATGNYELEYSEEERRYFANKIAEKHAVLNTLIKPAASKTLSLLDVGCGEGWSLAYFKEQGWDVTGLDFSSYGCQKFNPQCSENLLAGDVYENVQKLVVEGRKFDCVWLLNLLEHVTDPIKLLEDLKVLVADDGVLMVQVPNDFSDVHQTLTRDGHITREFWVAPPTHLSYFNRDGLRAIMTHTRWTERFLMSDFWIELNLFNPHANYVEDRAVGKGAYRQRVAVENMLHDISPDKAIALYEKAADIGLGRNLIGFYKKA